MLKFDLQFFAASHEGLTIADLTPAFKTKYIGQMRNTVVERRYIQNYLKKNKQTEDVGNTYQIAYQTQGSEGFGMAAYNATLPKARQSAYAYGTGTIKHEFGRVLIWGADIDATKNDSVSFVKAVENEIKSFTNAYATDQERQMVWDGGATPLATGVSVTDASPMVVTCSSTKYLRRGMPIDFLDSSHAAITNGANQVIEAITSDTTFTCTLTDTSGAEITGATRTTFAGAVSTTGTIFRAGGHDAEFHGFKSLIGTATNTIANINRSTAGNEWYVPNVYRIAAAGGIEASAASGTAKDWEIKDLRKLVDRILVQKYGADKTKLQIWSDGSVRDYYIDLWSAKGGYHQEAPKVDGWPYDTVAFDGIPWLSAYYMLSNTIFVPDMSVFVDFVEREMDWQNMDGNMWKWVSNYDAYEAYTVERRETGVYEPNKCATLYDVKGIDD